MRVAMSELCANQQIVRVEENDQEQRRAKAVVSCKVVGDVNVVD